MVFLVKSSCSVVMTHCLLLFALLFPIFLTQFLNASIPPIKSQVDLLLDDAEMKKLEYNREGISIALKALEMSLKQNDKLRVGRSYRILGYLSQEFGEYKKALEYGQKGLMYTSGTGVLEIDIINCMGLVYFHQANYGRAMEFFTRALRLSGSYHYPFGEAEALLNNGRVHWKTGMLDKAIENILHALKIFESLKNPKKIAESTLILGNVYLEMQQVDLAIGTYKKGLEINRLSNCKRQEALFIGSIGYAYSAKGEYKKALEYYNGALDIWKTIDEKVFFGNMLYYIGKAYMNLKDWKKSLAFFNRSNLVKHEINAPWDIIRNNIYISEVYRHLKRYDDARQLLSVTLKMAIELNTLTLERDIRKEWSILSEAMGNFNEALSHYKAYETLRNRISSEDGKKRVTELREKFEAEKREKDISILVKQGEIKSLQIARARSKNMIFGMGMGIVSLLSLLLLYFYLLSRRTRQKLEKALSEIQILSGFLPICAWCKKIRSDTGYWERLETYIEKRSKVEFSHGICPDCRKKMEDELDK